jgi:hypothetical protein
MPRDLLLLTAVLAVAFVLPFLLARMESNVQDVSRARARRLR